MPTEITHHFQNFYVTKLREACSESATTIYVDTPPEIDSGVLCLEYANQTKAEIIYFAGVSGYALTGCVRGMEGTTAQTHNIGADVRQNVTAAMLEASLNIQVLQSVDGDDMNNAVSQKAIHQKFEGLNSLKQTGTGNKVEFSTSATQPLPKANTDIIWFEPQD